MFEENVQQHILKETLRKHFKEHFSKETDLRNNF